MRQVLQDLVTGEIMQVCEGGGHACAGVVSGAVQVPEGRSFQGCGGLW